MWHYEEQKLTFSEGAEIKIDFMQILKNTEITLPSGMNCSY